MRRLTGLGPLAFVASVIALCLPVHGHAAARKAGSVFRDCPNCPSMVVIPAGSATIGSTEEEEAREGVLGKFAVRERPRQTVTLAAPFAVSRTEVTRAQYAVFSRATDRPANDGCYFPGAALANTPGKSWRDPGYPQTDKDPVTCVSWEDAKAYAAWLAKTTGKPYRLPTEGEWEYAARAGSAAMRYWGDDKEAACAYANVFDTTAAAALPWGAPAGESRFGCADRFVYTAPVGSFRPNAFGLYDMLGNLAEWTEDCANNETMAIPADGSAWVGGECKLRRFRGGSWRNSPWYVRAATRFSDPPTGHYGFLTIRLARALD